MTKDDLVNLDNWRIAMDDSHLPSADQQEARVNFYQWLYHHWDDVSKPVHDWFDQQEAKVDPAPSVIQATS